MSESKELEQIWFVLKKRFWIVVLITIIGFVLGYGVSTYVVKPTYTSSTTLLVNDQSKPSADRQSDISLINTYKDLIVSTEVLKPVVQNIDENLSVPEVRKMISVTTNVGSQVFSINVKSKDGDQATEIANDVSKEFQNKLSSMMNVKNVSTIDSAQDDNQVKNTKNMFYTLIFAAVFGGGSFVMFLLIDTGRREEKNVSSSRMSRLK